MWHYKWAEYANSNPEAWIQFKIRQVQRALSRKLDSFSHTVYIHTVFSLYAIYRYLANLHSTLPRIFCRYRMCSHRKPKLSIFVQMAPIIIITMHWRPQISWRSILQRRAQRSHQQNTTEMSFCSIRVLMLEYSIHNTKKKKKKGWRILLKYSPSILFSFTCSLRKISAF